MNRKIKAVIFDMDGVIFNSEQYGVKCFLESCKKMGIEATPDPYIKTMGTTYAQSDEIMMKFFKDEKIFRQTMKIYDEIFRNSYKEGKILFKKGAEKNVFENRRDCKIFCNSR